MVTCSGSRVDMTRAISLAICLSSALFASCGRPHSADRGVPASRRGNATKQSMPCLQVPAYVVKTLNLPPGFFVRLGDNSGR